MIPHTAKSRGDYIVIKQPNGEFAGPYLPSRRKWAESRAHKQTLATGKVYAVGRIADMGPTSRAKLLHDASFWSRHPEAI